MIDRPGHPAAGKAEPKRIIDFVGCARVEREGLGLTFPGRTDGFCVLPRSLRSREGYISRPYDTDCPITWHRCPDLHATSSVFGALWHLWLRPDPTRDSPTCERGSRHYARILRQFCDRTGPIASKNCAVVACQSSYLAAVAAGSQTGFLTLVFGNPVCVRRQQALRLTTISILTRSPRAMSVPKN